MDRGKLSDLFDEVLCGESSSASDAIAELTPEERAVVLNALRLVECEAEACAGRGSVIRAVLARFAGCGRASNVIQ